MSIDSDAMAAVLGSEDDEEDPLVRLSERAGLTLVEYEAVAIHAGRLGLGGHRQGAARERERRAQVSRARGPQVAKLRRDAE